MKMELAGKMRSEGEGRITMSDDTEGYDSSVYVSAQSFQSRNAFYRGHPFRHAKEAARNFKRQTVQQSIQD